MNLDVVALIRARPLLVDGEPACAHHEKQIAGRHTCNDPARGRIAETLGMYRSELP